MVMAISSDGAAYQGSGLEKLLRAVGLTRPWVTESERADPEVRRARQLLACYRHTRQKAKHLIN
jgi:hypothetical protein